jgi:hypothetical protein
MTLNGPTSLIDSKREAMAMLEIAADALGGDEHVELIRQ